MKIQPNPRATRREWLGLAVIALPCLLYSMDVTVLDLAVPFLTADLRPSGVQLLWILDVYGFVLAGSLIPMGTSGDRFGRRRLLMLGAAAFGLMSIVAAFSRSAGMLIAARAGLGLAGATLAPSTLSLIRNMFRDSSERAFAVGIWVASYSAGTAMGPIVGGLLLERFFWGSVFLISVPIMVLLLVLAPMLLPEFKSTNPAPIDGGSAILSSAAVLLSVYGLKGIAQDGPQGRFVLCLMAGLGVALLFVRRQRRSRRPLIDLNLLRAEIFRESLIAYTLASFVGFGVYVFVAQYLQWVLGLSPLRAGLWTAPFALAFAAGSQLTPRVALRMRKGSAMALGLLVAALGFGALAFYDQRFGPLVLATGTVVFALGLAVVVTLANDLMIGSAPPEGAGAAAALSETCSELGGALGIAMLGSLGGVVYRHALGRGLPQGLAPDVMASARDNLGGALALAEKLPPALASELSHAARMAFVQSFQVACEVAAFISGVLAFALILSPRARQELTSRRSVA